MHIKSDQTLYCRNNNNRDTDSQRTRSKYQYSFKIRNQFNSFFADLSYRS